MPDYTLPDLQSFNNDRDLAKGAFLLAELDLGLHSQETGRDLETCVRELDRDMESSLR